MLKDKIKSMYIMNKNSMPITRNTYRNISMQYYTCNAYQCTKIWEDIVPLSFIYEKNKYTRVQYTDTKYSFYQILFYLLLIMPYTQYSI